MIKRTLVLFVLSLAIIYSNPAGAEDKYPGMVLVPAGEFTMGVDEAQVKKNC